MKQRPKKSFNPNCAEGLRKKKKLPIMRFKMKKGFITRKLTILTVLVSISNVSIAGTYLPGDFHQHTLYTDGSYPFFTVMASNVEYGLD